MTVKKVTAAAFSALLSFAFLSCSSDSGNDDESNSSSSLEESSSSSLSSSSVSSSSSVATGGIFSKPFSVGLDTYGYIEVGGQISAITVGATANAVIAISFTANGKTPEEIYPEVKLGSVVNLDGTNLFGVCTALNSTKSIKVTVEVTAKFKTGADLVDSKEITIDCSIITDSDLVFKTITLSNAKSYGDLDAGKTYTEAEIKGSTATAKLIDVIAYGTATAADFVYAPASDNNPLAEYYNDITWVNDEIGDYNMYNIGGLVLPAESVAILASATKLSQTAPFLDMLDDILDGDFVYDFPATAGTGFIIVTSTGDLKVVINIPNGTKIIDLKAIALD